MPQLNRTHELHQALHGYAEGHHLLQSSIRLPTDAERTLLVLSDISGPTVRATFKVYLSGYPLNGGFYALARTWLATEMPRPGSVWTHTLLIPISMLDEGLDPATLLPLFRRPEKEAGKLEAYTLPLVPPEVPTPNVELNDIPTKLTSEIIAALYQQSSRPVVVLTTAFECYERLTIALWRQQWPRLRSRFTFCTAALAPRRLARIPFDFQIAPPTVRPQHADINAIVIDATVERSPNLQHPLWVAGATAALSEPKHSFNAFIGEFGEDTVASRSSFAALAEIYSVASRESNQSTTELIDVTSQRFPKPGEARRLKIVLFGEASSQWSLIVSRVISEAALLESLIQSGRGEAFDPKDLRVRERAENLAANRGARITLLINRLRGDHLLSPVGQSFLAGVVDSIRPEDVSQYTEMREEVLMALCRANPKLITMPSSWQSSQIVQMKLWDVVRSQKWDVETIHGIVESLLKGANETLAEEAVDILGDTAVLAALDWVDVRLGRKELDGMPVAWQRALARRRSAILTWLRHKSAPKSRTIALIAQMVLQKFVTKPGESDLALLREIAQTESKSYSVEARNEFMALLFSLALQDVGCSPEDFAMFAFHPVHDAAAKDELSDDAWVLLEPHVPFLWSRNWDKCERLREALADSFLRYNWSPGVFLKVASDEATLKRIVAYMAETRDGRTFLRRAAEEGAADLVSTKVVRDMVSDYKASRRWR